MLALTVLKGLSAKLFLLLFNYLMLIGLIHFRIPIKMLSFCWYKSYRLLLKYVDTSWMLGKWTSLSWEPNRNGFCSFIQLQSDVCCKFFENIPFWRTSVKWASTSAYSVATDILHLGVFLKIAVVCWILCDPTSNSS